MSDVTAPPLDIRSVALTMIAIIAAILLLQYAQAVIIPVVLGILIRYALDPFVSALARLRIPRAIGAAMVLIVLVGTGGRLLYGLRGEATAMVAQLPEAARRLRQVVQTGPKATASAIQQVQKAAQELEKAADAAAPPPADTAGVRRVQVEPPPFNVSSYVVWGSIGLATAAGQIVLILFLVYFLLASGDLYRRKLVKIAPSFSQKKVTLQILEEIDRQIERFLLVQIFTCTLVGIATWLAFRALGVQQAGMWGLLAGVLNSIPYFGPVIVSAATATAAFLQFGDLRMAAIVSGAALVITSLDGFLITPWLTSRAAGMNAVAVFIGLLFWGWVWSVWGLLLAVPMLMVIKVVCDHIDDYNAVGEILGQ